MNEYRQPTSINVSELKSRAKDAADKFLGNSRGKQKYIWSFRSVIMANMGGVVASWLLCSSRIEWCRPRVLCCDLKQDTLLSSRRCFNRYRRT